MQSYSASRVNVTQEMVNNSGDQVVRPDSHSTSEVLNFVYFSVFTYPEG